MQDRRILIRRCEILAAASTLVASSLCAASTFGPGVSQGVVNSGAIVEASGLVASRNNPGVIWTENDSGNPNTIFALDLTGHLLGNYTLTGATNTDWEDIAIGPGPTPGVDYLYVTTIGDGKAGGTQVVRVPEPTVYTRQATAPVSKSLPGVQTKTFTFASGPVSDGESMFVDPANGDIYLGTKESPNTNFSFATQAQFNSASPQALTFAGSVPLSKGNGADISQDGSQIFVRNQGQFAFLYHRTAGQTIAQALANPSPDNVAVNGKDVEPNAESIAFDSDGVDFFTTSEGVNQPLYKYSRTSADGPVRKQLLVTAGATWKFIGGPAAGAGWQNPGFNDAGWSSGDGQFGYGTGDEKTTISSSNKSEFFRTTFNVADPSALHELTLKLLFDDGAAVYLNGVEIKRLNLANGAAPGDFASPAQSDILQNSWFDFAINPSLLVAGTNTLAVEIHGSSAGDTDLRFDAQLQASTVPEPMMISLVGLGGLALMRRRRA